MSNDTSINNFNSVGNNTTGAPSKFGASVCNGVDAEALLTTEDCGIILRADGSFQIFAPQACDSSNFRENKSQELVERLQKLHALSIACAHPQVMQLLLNLSAELSAS